MTTVNASTPGRTTTLRWVAVAAASLFLMTGCGKKDDPIAQAEKKDVAKGVPAPGIAETKAIAEEGFIYGLPIVMNYAVMNEFAVDKNSSQFKAPFNEINNEPASSPTRTRRSSRRTATRRTRCSGWTCARSRW